MMLSSTIVLLLIVALVHQTRSLSPSEYTALYDLYTQTGGEYWEWKAPSEMNSIWNFTLVKSVSESDNICMQQWQGVKCNSLDCLQQPCFVIDLVLPRYGLKGTIPTSLKGLTSLSVLDLSNNILSTESLINTLTLAHRTHTYTLVFL